MFLQYLHFLDVHFPASLIQLHHCTPGSSSFATNSEKPVHHKNWTLVPLIKTVTTNKPVYLCFGFSEFLQRTFPKETDNRFLYTLSKLPCH